MEVPLEIRRMIYGLVCEEGNDLKKWFETVEVKERIAAYVTKYPNLPAPIAWYAADTEQSEENDDDDDNEDDKEDEDDGDDGDDEDDGDDQNKAPVFSPHHKWQHIPSIMDIPKSLPASNLLLVNKELNQEVKDWFYDSTTFKLDVTASWIHQSFFSETLAQLVTAAYPPILSLRRAEISIVWDTAWLRSLDSDYFESIYPIYLRDRVQMTLDLLRKMPHLEKLVVHWHNTAYDPNTNMLLYEIAEKFYQLSDFPGNIKEADIDFQEHILPAGIEPDPESVVGKRRSEFRDFFAQGNQFR